MTYLISKDFNLEISKGNVSGHTTVNKFGRNTQIDTNSDPEDVWDAGGVHAGPISAQTLAFVSDDTQDDAGGSGISQIRVWGLSDWDTPEVSEDITLNGTTAVKTTSTWVFVHRMQGLEAGSNQTAVGNIDCVYGASNTTMARIRPGEAQTHMALYAVPSASTFYVNNAYFAANKSGAAGTASCQFEILAYPNTTKPVMQDKSHIGLATAGSSFIDRIFMPPLVLSGPCLVKCNVQEVSQNGFDISAGFDGVLVRE